MPYANPSKSKEYHRNYMRRYLKKHPQTYTATQKRKRTARQKVYDQKRSALGYHLQKRYGISLEQYKMILARQGGHCAFCNVTKEKNGSRLSVDHDKRTKIVRGILCRRHNSALGTFGDTELSFRRVIKYLRGE